jgi:hypothetical protein
VDEREFRERLTTVMERLGSELAGAALVRRAGNDWTIAPTRAAASPL